MSPLKTSIFTLLAVAFGLAAVPCQAATIDLRRDATYEQNLRFNSSADTAITPARVLRWMLSLRGGRTMTGAPSKFEFQPIFRAKDSQRQFIAQYAYKF